MTSWHSILWAAPLVVVAAVIVGWAAETAQLYISQGLALAVLAWLQTSPEFAVEALIAWDQKQNLMVANLTGSLRLLVGFGWPLIYFTNALFGKEKKKGHPWPKIRLKWFNGLDVLILVLGTAYFLFIWLKGSITVADSVLLFGIYGLYLFELTHLPPGFKEGEEDLPWIGQKIKALPEKRQRWGAIFSLFLMGAILLALSTGPFLRGLESLAVLLGMSSFYFIQWCAPFVSEFPEKVTAFQWARTGRKAPMAIINMVSSNIVQWTLMAGMIPVVFGISKGHATPIIFDSLQLQEIAITILQSVLSILFLMDLEFDFWNATGLLVLWAFQFFFPAYRTIVMGMYGIWILGEVISLARKKKLFYALVEYRRQKRSANT